jgi:hypothetical protein
MLNVSGGVAGLFTSPGPVGNIQVNVVVSVSDSSGQGVKGLDQRNFSFRDFNSGRKFGPQGIGVDPMPINDFSDRDAPFYVFVLDASQGATNDLSGVGPQLITVEVTTFTFSVIPGISFGRGIKITTIVQDQGRLVIPFTNPVPIAAVS